MEIQPGNPYPLGATWDGNGVNFALYSAQAESVTLCFFDSPEAHREVSTITISSRTDMVWHVYVPGVGPGQLYAYRIDGPFLPERGFRCHPQKVLLDPYAKALGRLPIQNTSLYDLETVAQTGEKQRSSIDSAPFAALGIVVQNEFDWEGDRLLKTPWEETVVYEVHTKGFTQLRDDIPEEYRGRFLGLSSPPVIEYLRSLGVTALELLPIHQKFDEANVSNRGLTNYWGYSTLNYFSPDTRFAINGDPTRARDDFRQMVKLLHRAGIEVILDVVYNHTAEGDEYGPTLSFRGIDQRAYYRTAPTNPGKFVDFSGCGNTLNLQNPATLRLVLDSLRYWVLDMHVDGFRFDLATALAREEQEYSSESAFLLAIHQDPVLSQVKLIAEPWDCGIGGYQVGNFPNGWSEWNGQFRDTMRKFWRGDGGLVGAFASRLAGSSDLFAARGRAPTASVNFITSHDGFPMRDLVSYSEKHNEANGEENKDGENNNYSWNFGTEGETAPEDVLGLRKQCVRNLFASLLLSVGVPMITAGDEFGRSQCGNNNAYCQDNELSWVSWKFSNDQRLLIQFVRDLLKLRKETGLFRRKAYFQGNVLSGESLKDLAWYTFQGEEMRLEHWEDWERRSIAALFSRREALSRGRGGEFYTEQQILIVVNACSSVENFHFPLLFPTAQSSGNEWELLFDTHEDGFRMKNNRGIFQQKYEVQGRSFVAFRSISTGEKLR